jgi:hypothetical protein
MLLHIAVRLEPHCSSKVLSILPSARLEVSAAQLEHHRLKLLTKQTVQLLRVAKLSCKQTAILLKRTGEQMLHML